MSIPRKLQYPTELPHWKGVSFTKDQKKVRKENSWFDDHRVDRTIQFLKYLRKNPHPTIVPILNWRRQSPNEYSYFMPLLAKLSDSETELVDLVTSGDDYKRSNRHRIYRLKKNHPKLSQFIQKVNSWKTYLDLYEGNIMRDKYGNYKVIDIEGFGFAHYSSDEIISSITARR